MVPSNDLGVIFEQASPFLFNFAVKVCEKIIMEKKSDVVFFTFFFGCSDNFPE